MQVLGFHHLAIQVRHVDACARFYRDVLGLTEQVRHFHADGSLRSIWLTWPDGEVPMFIALEQKDASRPTEPHLGMSTLALRIRREDRARALEHLAKAGVTVEHQTRWTVYFRDPEGNRVALSHYPADPL